MVGHQLTNGFTAPSPRPRSKQLQGSTYKEVSAPSLQRSIRVPAERAGMGFAKERNRELLSNGDRVLRKDRIELLEEIGFNWEVNRRIGQSKIKRDSGGLKQSYFIHTKMGKLSK